MVSGWLRLGGLPGVSGLTYEPADTLLCCLVNDASAGSSEGRPALTGRAVRRRSSC